MLKIDILLEQDPKYVEEYILNAPKQEQKQYLVDERVKKFFLKQENHYPFIWLVQNLNNESFKIFLDDDMLDRIYSTEHFIDKINGIMSAVADDKNIVLNNEKTIEIMIENNLSMYFYYMNIDFFNSVLKYIIKNSKSFDSLKNFSDSVLVEAFSNQNNIDLLLNSKIPNDILLIIPTKSLKNYFNYEKFQELFKKSDIYIIDKLISKGLIISDTVIKNSNIEEKYLNLNSIAKYRIFINNLENKMPSLAQIINDKRKLQYKDLINSITDDGLLKEYQDIYDSIINNTVINKINTDANFILNTINYQIPKDEHFERHVFEFLKEKSNNKIIEIIIDQVFKETSYNFLKNISSIIEFIEESDISIVPQERLDIYKKLLSFDELSLNDIKELYESVKDKDYSQEYYDDFSKAKKKSYNLLNEKTLKSDEIEKYKTDELSEKYGVPICELKGQEFVSFVHTTSFEKDRLDNLKSFESLPFYNNKMPAATSFSLIGNSLISTYGNPREEITFGFFNIDPKRIVNVFYSDSYSSCSIDIETSRIQKIYTPEQLLRNTKGYNEILYQNKNVNMYNEEVIPLKPDYLVCYDEINDNDVKISHMFDDLPIVLIYTKYYNTKYQKPDLDSEEEYIYDDFDLSKYRKW